MLRKLLGFTHGLFEDGGPHQFSRRRTKVMRSLFLKTLAIPAVVGMASASQAYESDLLTLSSGDNYRFKCEAQSLDGYHKLSVFGGLSASRNSLRGEEVTVVVENQVHGVFRMPAHSIWFENGEISRMYLRGTLNNRKGFLLQYSGEGSLANRLEVSDANKLLASDQVSCEVSESPF